MYTSIADRQEKGPGVLARFIELGQDIELSSAELRAMARPSNKIVWASWYVALEQDRVFLIEDEPLYRMSLILDIHRDLTSRYDRALRQRWFKRRIWGPLAQNRVPMDIFCADTDQIEAFRARLLLWGSQPGVGVMRVVALDM